MPLLADPARRSRAPTASSGPAGFVRRAIFLIDGEGVVRYRHVALFGLRYQDVDDLDGPWPRLA